MTQHSRKNPEHRPFGLATAGIVAGLLAACVDIPTSAPVIESSWIVPAPGQVIGLGTLLPGNVQILADSSGFSLSSPPATVTRSLAQDCPACVPFNGLTVPKPQFTVSTTTQGVLPADIVSATLTGGTLAVRITNNYNFDPLNPSASPAGAKGWAVITVNSGAVQLGKDSVNGATTSLPANGGTLTRTLSLAGIVTSASGISATVTIFSPAGDNVQINTSRTLVVEATPSNLRVASASVTIPSRSVTSSTTFDLDIDSTVVNHVTGGRLLLTIANPFGVTGTLTITLTPTGKAPITRPVQLTAGTTTQSLAFSQAELRSILSGGVAVTYSGTVSAPGTVTVTPRQAIVVTTKLALDLRTGD